MVMCSGDHWKTTGNEQYGSSMKRTFAGDASAASSKSFASSATDFSSSKMLNHDVAVMFPSSLPLSAVSSDVAGVLARFLISPSLKLNNAISVSPSWQLLSPVLSSDATGVRARFSDASPPASTPGLFLFSLILFPTHHRE
ncbi:hypothetical protein NMG60_11021990 [Bertholletia excelsa]